MSRACGLSAVSRLESICLQSLGVWTPPRMCSCLRLGSWNLQGRSVVPRRLPGPTGMESQIEEAGCTWCAQDTTRK